MIDVEATTAQASDIRSAIGQLIPLIEDKSKAMPDGRAQNERMIEALASVQTKVEDLVSAVQQDRLATVTAAQTITNLQITFGQAVTRMELTERDLAALRLTAGNQMQENRLRIEKIERDLEKKADRGRVEDLANDVRGRLSIATLRGMFIILVPWLFSAIMAFIALKSSHLIP